MTARKPKSEHGKSGQPTPYKEEYNDMAYVACSEGGFTDLKLARLFKVTKSTINNWKRSYPKFFASIREGKDEFNCSCAENSLLKRVLGYKIKEVVKEPRFVTDEKDKHGNPLVKMVITKVTTKEVPPEPTSVRFFLKNRDSKRWPDKFDIGEIGDINVIINKFSDEPKETNDDEE